MVIAILIVTGFLCLLIAGIALGSNVNGSGPERTFPPEFPKRGPNDYGEG